jgi:hypothetical protein
MDDASFSETFDAKPQTTKSTKQDTEPDKKGPHRQFRHIFLKSLFFVSGFK